MALWLLRVIAFGLLVYGTLGNREGYAFTDFYNYRDETALSVCVTVNAGAIFAVRRICASGQPNCADICTSVGQNCLFGLRIHNNSRRLSPDPREDTGVVGLKIERSNDCSAVGCGSNYCCCRD